MDIGDEKALRELCHTVKACLNIQRYYQNEKSRKY